VILVFVFSSGKMTNQNVVVADTNSGLNLAITVHVTNSSIFTTAAQKPPAAPGGYISISRKKLLKNLEINGGARINAWVDSMRASSPTHIKSTPSVNEDQSSWIVSTRRTQKPNLYTNSSSRKDQFCNYQKMTPFYLFIFNVVFAASPPISTGDV